MAMLTGTQTFPRPKMLTFHLSPITKTRYKDCRHTLFLPGVYFPRDFPLSKKYLEKGSRHPHSQSSTSELWMDKETTTSHMQEEIRTKDLLEAAKDIDTQRYAAAGLKDMPGRILNENGKWNIEIPSLLASKSYLICQAQFSTLCGIFACYSFSIPTNSSSSGKDPTI